MSDAETRALARAAALLLAASLARLAWSPPSPSPAGPGRGEGDLPALLEETRARTAEAESRAAPLSPGERLDPNDAPEAELDRLPGVGPATARAVVESRRLQGPFATAEDLLRVPGVGPALLERIRPHLSVGPGRSLRGGPPARASAVPGDPPRAPAPPVDLNRADTTLLQTLPGVGPALARRIAEARRAGPFRTVDDLARVRGIGPATVERLRPLVTVGR